MFFQFYKVSQTKKWFISFFILLSVIKYCFNKQTVFEVSSLCQDNLVKYGCHFDDVMRMPLYFFRILLVYKFISLRWSDCDEILLKAFN